MSSNRKNKREKNTITAFCEANFPRVVTTVMTLHIKPFPQLLSVLENPFLLPASDALTTSGTALCSPKGFMASQNDTEQLAIMANLTAHHSSPIQCLVAALSSPMSSGACGALGRRSSNPTTTSGQRQQKQTCRITT